VLGAGVGGWLSLLLLHGGWRRRLPTRRHHHRAGSMQKRKAPCSSSARPKSSRSETHASIFIFLAFPPFCFKAIFIHLAACVSEITETGEFRISLSLHSVSRASECVFVCAEHVQKQSRRESPFCLLMKKGFLHYLVVKSCSIICTLNRTPNNQSRRLLRRRCSS
jgi:hypothetical protein